MPRGSLSFPKLTEVNTKIRVGEGRVVGKGEIGKRQAGGEVGGNWRMVTMENGSQEDYQSESI